MNDNLYVEQNEFIVESLCNNMNKILGLQYV